MALYGKRPAVYHLNGVVIIYTTVEHVGGSINDQIPCGVLAFVLGPALANHRLSIGDGSKG
jgi:hypothetical protein